MHKIHHRDQRQGREQRRRRAEQTHYRCTGMPTQSSAVTHSRSRRTADALACQLSRVPSQPLGARRSTPWQVLPVTAIRHCRGRTLSLPSHGRHSKPWHCRGRKLAQSLRVLSGHERSKCTPVHVLAAATRWQSQLSSLLAHATHLFASVGVFCACAGAPSDGQISSLTLPSLPALALSMPQAVAAITLPSQPV